MAELILHGFKDGGDEVEKLPEDPFAWVVAILSDGTVYQQTPDKQHYIKVEGCTAEIKKRSTRNGKKKEVK